MAKKNENGVLCAVLAYLLIGIIWYFVDEEVRDDFVRFHVRQAVALLIFGIVLSIAGIIIGFIPFIGWLIHLVISLCMLILWLIGLVGALQGKKREIPIAGSFAKSFAF